MNRFRGGSNFVSAIKLDFSQRLLCWPASIFASSSACLTARRSEWNFSWGDFHSLSVDKLLVRQNLALCAGKGNLHWLVVRSWNCRRAHPANPSVSRIYRKFCPLRRALFAQLHRHRNVGTRPRSRATQKFHGNALARTRSAFSIGSIILAGIAGLFAKTDPTLFGCSR